MNSNFDNFIRYSPNAILLVDLTGHILKANEQTHQLLGYTSEALKGQPIEVLVPDTNPHHQRLRDDYMRQPRPRYLGQDLAIKARHKNGALISVEAALIPLTSDNDEVAGVIVTLIDIRQQLATERNLTDVIEHSPNSIITTNHLGQIDIVNAQAVQLFGYPRAELVGQQIEVLLPEALHHHHRQLRHDYMASPSVKTMGKGRDLQGRHKDGTLIDVEVALAPLFDTEQKPSGVVATIIDIRQRLFTKRQLAKQIDDLKRTNQELDQFAYVASHDLKSPLNAIQKIVGWIEEDCGAILPQSSQQHLQLLEQRTQRLMRLLDDLLAYSRANRFEYEQQTIELNTLANELYALIDAPKEIQFECDHVQLKVPRSPFETILNNLMSNAVKHRDNDTRKIQIHYHTSHNTHYLEVEDDGPGIPPSLHEKAVSMFQTLQPRDRVEGSGMGLALVKKIIEHQGGSLTIRSDGSRGTTIALQWPFIETAPKDISFNGR
ncbi:sensor histidine kinase [Celerinatantimonas yamalensis]|uniref:histidine kinase n=1 Tax=Celerinatantimonas yamalensis TaxID=559956 RepID=A0ABW9G771_9GAMM